ncbi:MAG TPA: TIR domain-containing protein [Sphingomicrobium sp.]|nr:TIR domain-containing protein [Sphingomicrobium sp.]
MSGVFLSYKAEDRLRVKPLVDALEADGLSVWWDTQITAGTEWRKDIQEHLDAAACVIVVWSKRAVGPEGRFVRDEATRAQRQGTYLPVRIDKVEPPLGFGEVQAISLTGWKGDREDPRYHSLLSAVHATIAGEKRLQPTISARGMPISRRSAVVGGGTVAGLAAVAGGWTLLKPGRAGAANSIAVLPFANLSGDANEAYFANGIAEELRSALSRLKGLRVAGRISSEAVRDADAATAGRRLRVANILTGSVRRAPGVIRVASQLISGRDGLERWSETYDRPDGNALAIQTDIAEKVVTALSIELGRAEIQALTAGGTHDGAAYDLYLRATNQVRNDDSETSLRQANAMLEAAIRKDPKFASAHAAKSRYQSYLADVGHSPDEIAEGYAVAVASARRALALAPRLPAGYAALADALYGQRKIRAAINQIQIGMGFGPNDIELLQAAVIAFVAAGETKHALDYADRMVGIDPLNSLSHRRRYYALFYGRQYEASIAAAHQTLKLAPELTLPPLFIAWCLIMTGRTREAQPYLEKMPPDLTVRLSTEAIVTSKLGDLAASDRKLEQLAKGYGDAASYQFAQAYAQRGEPDRAFAALERGFAVNDPGLNTLLVDPLFDPIRRDPRFAALAKRIDLTT